MALNCARPVTVTVPFTMLNCPVPLKESAPAVTMGALGPALPRVWNVPPAMVTVPATANWPVCQVIVPPDSAKEPALKALVDAAALEEFEKVPAARLSVF